MKFDNAFMCKSGVVGMQFISHSKPISVFHDGKFLQVSEDASPQEKLEAMRKYKDLHNRFKKH